MDKAQDASISPLVTLLRCLQCKHPVEILELAPSGGYPELGPDGWLRCTACAERYPIIAGTARMLDRPGRTRLSSEYPAAAINLADTADARHPARPSTRQRTADSFAYEWAHFGKLRSEWEQNFRGYLQPHPVESLKDRLILDVGAGSGRHSSQACNFGASVVAVDLGRSIDVARRNLPPQVLTVQADAERLPFQRATFDLVMSIGVLHHLPDTTGALNALVPFVADEGDIQVYLYWVPEARWHRSILALVTVTRRVTVRLPHALLRYLCYPLSALLWISVVLPQRLLRSRPWAQRLTSRLPLKTYSDYPFGVLVNDQFDRFSAPIEHRFTAAQVKNMLERAGLEEIVVTAHHGWVGTGKRRLARQGRSQTPQLDR
jgi:SAM-dependent methyltransferase/uncharacterized protein YbaR (Trm112 family)